MDNKNQPVMIKNKMIVAALLFGCIACNNAKEEEKKGETTNENVKKSSITEKPFGNFEDKAVTEYTLTNANGMQVGIINYGGTITKIITPDKNGSMGDVITGFESLDGFRQKGNPYFGALIGRYGNRIAHAKFAVDGKEYTLAANDNGNSLHGGNKGYDKVYWTIEKQTGDSSLKLTYLSKDGEEGYPGNLQIQVVYTLTGDNALKLEYTATTDKATPINLTSHGYFNLSAGVDSTILNHRLMINADKYTPVDDKLIPTGKMDPVKGTAMDFTTAKAVGQDIAQVKGGYDHNWILREGIYDKSVGPKLEMAAILSDNASGRVMEVWTTEPGVQFYTGNFLDGTLTNTKGGKKYVKHSALCLETQHFPDSPNQPGFPTTILKPGETYKHTTVYKFSVK
jgi:aldose 1-epimerase